MRYQPPQPPTLAEVREYSDDAAAEREKGLDERLTHTWRERAPPPRSVTAEMEELEAAFQRLEGAFDACTHAQHRRGLNQLVAAHLLEAWAVGCFGAKNAGHVLMNTAALFKN